MTRLEGPIRLSGRGFGMSGELLKDQTTAYAYDSLGVASQNDYERLDDLFCDIGGTSGELEHIRSHVADARKAFDVLLRLLDEKSRNS